MQNIDKDGVIFDETLPDGSYVDDLITALETATAFCRDASAAAGDKGQAFYVETPAGAYPVQVTVVQRTLTDGSRTQTVVLRMEGGE